MKLKQVRKLFPIGCHISVEGDVYVVLDHHEDTPEETLLLCGVFINPDELRKIKKSKKKKKKGNKK